MEDHRGIATGYLCGIRASAHCGFWRLSWRHEPHGVDFCAWQQLVDSNNAETYDVRLAENLHTRMVA
jgi:hypothetical protein